ncbi:MAG: succinate dehydrogenase cytochrome b subunit [Planctomycetaceae bacterium]|jgi:succinate dehydrogenase / fumarate reductase cytochrome b subunit|nr:succinate dehydrogenase cytochrome b subunit [Planctomycetaceae bacterium]
MINFIFSSIGKKLIMSLSGLFLVIFLVVHVSLNMTALFSRKAYEIACQFMDSNLLVQILVPVLAMGFIVHIICSALITLKNQNARPVKYLVANKAEASSWASKNMFVLGVIVLGFLGLHFFHFWAKMQLQHILGNDGENAYDLLVALFSKWYYCVLYIVWVIALYFHISHGFWSAFQSIGANNSKWLPRLKLAAKIYAIIITLAFISIPIYFFLLGLNSCCIK